ncbi:MAG: YceI family protein [Lysobacteraceae bacterium]
MKRPLSPLFALSMLLAGTVQAAPVVYRIDPEHTFPSFEADHMAGLSVWRGKFNHVTGAVTFDKAKGSGTLDVSIDIDSIDFGHDQLNAHAKGADFFDVALFPKATYTGRLEGIRKGKPTHVVGQLTLHGVTKPVVLKINVFKCMPHPMLKREVCGADAYATLERDQFGIAAGNDWGFDMTAVLRIQVEAVAAE